MLYKYPAPVQVSLGGGGPGPRRLGCDTETGERPAPNDSGAHTYAPRGLGSANHGPCSSLLQVAVQVAAHVASHLVRAEAAVRCAGLHKGRR